MTELFNLTGRTALVTGCSRGIGQAMAEGLAEAGADLIGVSHSLKSGSEVETNIKRLGKHFTPYSADFGNREALYQFIETVNQNHTVDILINNAGIILRNPAAQHSDEEWDSV